MADVFEFHDYKKFLNSKLDELDRGGRGSRARLSKAIGCQTAYTAQVLRGSAQFSLEQAEAINDFLGHTEEQGHFLLLLIQKARAGTTKLRLRFDKQIEAMLESRSLLKNRLLVKDKLGEKEQVRYYSAWIYGAVHALVSIPGFQSAEKISQRLQLDLQLVRETLEFLIQSGLIEKTRSGDLRIGKGQIHLGSDSSLIYKHHINWRMVAIRAIESDPKAGLHYSSVVSVSKKDMKLIRETLIETIQKLKPIIRDSAEEELCSLSLDFFRV